MDFKISMLHGNFPMFPIPPPGECPEWPWKPKNKSSLGFVAGILNWLNETPNPSPTPLFANPEHLHWTTTLYFGGLFVCFQTDCALTPIGLNRIFSVKLDSECGEYYTPGRTLFWKACLLSLAFSFLEKGHSWYEAAGHNFRAFQSSRLKVNRLVLFLDLPPPPLVLGSQPRKMTAWTLKQLPKGKTHKSKNNRPSRNAGDGGFCCKRE